MEEDMDLESFSDDIDPEYEFDACHFYDFSRDETESEAQEAESWFQYAHENPPSPFIVKLKLMKASKSFPVKVQKTSSGKTEADQSASTSSISDGDIDHEVPTTEVKTKGAKGKSTVNSSKPSSSTFMKPTASHLAKQNKESKANSGSCGRMQMPLVKADERLRSPTKGEILATKRQKLDVGYLRKVAQLKHQTSFLHKISKKVAQLEASSNSRRKTTIPRKPVLVTEERARRHRSQSKSESGQQPKANTHAFKARPLNKKILDTPKLSQHKKTMTHLTEFQEFNLKTTHQATQHQTASVLHKQNSAPAMLSEDILIKGENSPNAWKNDKCRSPNNFKPCITDKVHPIRDGGFTLNAKHNCYLPPVELFKKLSLRSGSEPKIISSLKPHHLSKSLKENGPRSFQQEFKKFPGKPNQRRMTLVKTQPKINRSVDMR